MQVHYVCSQRVSYALQMISDTLYFAAQCVDEQDGRPYCEHETLETQGAAFIKGLFKRPPS